jgi:hypothetical protein
MHLYHTNVMLDSVWSKFLYKFHNPEEGGSTVFQNNGIQPPHYIVQQPRNH